MENEAEAFQPASANRCWIFSCQGLYLEEDCEPDLAGLSWFHTNQFI